MQQPALRPLFVQSSSYRSLAPMRSPLRLDVVSFAVALVGVTATVAGCGGSTGGPSTFSSSELPKAQAFLDQVKPPHGFTRETKTCIKAPTTRCFTSPRVVQPLTPASVLATIRQIGSSQTRLSRVASGAGVPGDPLFIAKASELLAATTAGTPCGPALQTGRSWRALVSR